jgi:hypothetical protein
MAGILQRAKTAASQYPPFVGMACVSLGGTNGVVTAKPYPLLMAYDRALIIDEVVVRGAVTGSGTTAQLTVAASGTAGDSAAGTDFGAAVTLNTVADNTNQAMDIHELQSEVAAAMEPRVVPAGSTLFIDFETVAGNPADWIVYVRYQEKRE